MGPDAASRVLAACRTRQWRLATAESCTGGLIAAALTAIAGSSDVVEAGFVTYSNEAKTLLVGVPAALIGQFGAVSEPVARAMAEGVLDRLAAVDLAVSVTGIAGPTGATPGKPVGLVHFGLAMRGTATRHDRAVFTGSRAEIRAAAVGHALDLLLQACA